MVRTKYHFLIIVITLSVFQCSKDYNIISSKPYINTHLDSAQSREFEFNNLSFTERPYHWEYPAPYDYFEIDSEGIAIRIIDDKYYYHPVQIAQVILRLIDSYYYTYDTNYINIVKLQADKLLEIAVQQKDAIYFPYTFDFTLHETEDDVLFAPWYSGMAQGQILSALTRIYSITKDKKYFYAAHRVFNSFVNKRENDFDIWISFVDAKKYYWIEEYPLEYKPTRVLNGFIFAIFGLYDYYLLSKNVQSKKILKFSITTIKQYVHLYRNPGNWSYYCLRHKRSSLYYHKIHTEQLGYLYKITNDPYFLDMANKFYNDAH